MAKKHLDTAVMRSDFIEIVSNIMVVLLVILLVGTVFFAIYWFGVLVNYLQPAFWTNFIGDTRFLLQIDTFGSGLLALIPIVIAGTILYFTSKALYFIGLILYNRYYHNGSE